MLPHQFLDLLGGAGPSRLVTPTATSLVSQVLVWWVVRRTTIQALWMLAHPSSSNGTTFTFRVVVPAMAPSLESFALAQPEYPEFVPGGVCVPGRSARTLVA